MRDRLPTRDEILDKYRGVIDSDDFEILAGRAFPRPETLHQEDASLQYLGTLSGAFLWAKRQFGKVITVIVFFGGLVQGLEYINKYSRLAYEQVATVLQAGQQHCGIPATEYRIFEPPKQWALPADEPYALTDFEPTTSTTSTTTTTTPSPARTNTFGLLRSGSGLIPYSDEWRPLA